MNTISPIDAAFLRMESRRTPMHVGGLLVFQLPDHVPRDFLRDLWDRMRTMPFMPPPFNCRIRPAGLRRLLPTWEPVDFDIDYHLRHSALPYPGGERELGILVARLHSHPMDMTRPLWECHLIEGLENNRFALYFKAHHCAIDGMAAMKLVRNWLSEDPHDLSGPSAGTVKRNEQPPREPLSFRSRLLKPVTFAGTQIRSARELIHTLRAMSLPGIDSGMRAAIATPRSLFNVPVSQQRRLGTQVLDLPRIKAIGAATGTTV
ncbi:MAG TPA: wax ester/triacylglycerol synthase family O-acyltransferase, partial [Nevskiaceae bacterium]|nr:wax ester/triacylglycerol synthase family O-acyltransferase [Nevskiaceae bacterium]